jgi:thiol peroxidase
MAAVDFGDNRLELTGDLPANGQAAPGFTALDNGLKPVSLSDFKGKVVLIAAVPSLDTGVCDTETRKFNEAASALGDDVVVLTVSVDLPFAQARWCGAAGVERVLTLSDHRDLEFGRAYGVLIGAVRLLARSVFVVDREGTLRYQQLVEQTGTEPDYDAALAAVKELV